MYDSYLVEKGSLKNEVKDGKVTGFSFGVRLSNYRGIYLSLVNGFYVNVDGVDYPRETQFMEINGKAPRSMDEIEKSCWEHWNMQDTAYLHIEKEGGLAPGTHQIKYLECTLGGYGYNPTDEEYVTNPPKPGDTHSGGKTSVITTFELELKKGSE